MRLESIREHSRAIEFSAVHAIADVDGSITVVDIGASSIGVVELP